VTCTLEDAARAAFRALKPGGKFALCLPPERIGEALSTLEACRLTPKTLRLVFHDENHPPKLLLLRAAREAKPGLAWLPPLLLKTADGRESEEYRRIYRRG